MADDDLDIDEIRERAERVEMSIYGAPSIRGLDRRNAEKVLEDVPALCDEVERLREIFQDNRRQIYRRIRAAQRYYERSIDEDDKDKKWGLESSAETYLRDAAMMAMAIGETDLQGWAASCIKVIYPSRKIEANDE